MQMSGKTWSSGQGSYGIKWNKQRNQGQNWL